MASLIPYREHIRQPEPDTTLWQYACLVDRLYSEGKRAPYPKTREELDYLIEHYPLDAVPHLPHRDELARLGMSRNTCREHQIEPFSVEWREQYIETLDRDPEFAEAVRLRLGATNANL